MTGPPGDAGACEVGELFSAYLDGELQPGELERIVEHLTDCEPCIVEFHQLQEVRAAVRTLPRLEVPERLIPLSHHGAALSAYLDGELATAEHELVFVHLARCVECREELHDLDAARTAVRSLPRVEPPQLIARSTAERAVPRLRRRSWQVAVAAASAAAVLLVVGVATQPPEADAPTVDLEKFGERHIARASVEPGFVVVPALSGNEMAP
jgi:anti-sigma factor RsiW